MSHALFCSIIVLDNKISTNLVQFDLKIYSSCDDKPFKEPLARDTVVVDREYLSDMVLR